MNLTLEHVSWFQALVLFSAGSFFEAALNKPTPWSLCWAGIGIINTLLSIFANH